jgi:hypothetical protein
MTRPCGTAAPFFLLFSQKREKKKRAAKTNAPLVLAGQRFKPIKNISVPSGSFQLTFND